MIRRAVCLAVCLAGSAPPSGEARANTIDCGDNSHSYAEVAAAPKVKLSKDKAPQAARRRGVVEVMPNSLCADLIERRRSGVDSIEVIVDPSARRP